MALVTEAPGPAVMLDEGPTAYFNATKSQLVKQKLEFAQMIYKYCTGNKYKIVQTPNGWGEGDGMWDEDAYDKAKKQSGKEDKDGVKRLDMMTAQEDSSWFCKLCCGPFRELTMNMREGEYYSGKDEMMMMYHRPFKFPINCVFCELCSPEMSVQNLDGTEVGKVIHDYSCMEDLCGKRSFAVNDSNGVTKYYIQDNTCPCSVAGCKNGMAPSPCCPLRTLKILDENKQEFPEGQAEGEESKAPSIQNIFACNIMRLCLPGLDQYKITYPEKATAEDKAILLAGLFLVEFTLFEHNEDGDE